MSQYLRKYKLSFLLPWTIDQDGREIFGTLKDGSPAVTGVLTGPARSIFNEDQGLSLIPSDSTSLPNTVAQIRNTPSATLKQLEEWRINRKENLAKRWEAFSQGGGEWGRDFEDGVGRFITIENLHIEFEIETASNDAETGGECEIAIYNLSDNSVKFLRNAAQRNVMVRLEAGYEGSFGIIYEGVVQGLEDLFEEEDRVTTVTCIKGGNLKDINLNKYYPKGTPLESALADMAKECGLTLNFPEEYESLYILRNDLYVSQPAQSALKQILESYGFTAAFEAAFIKVATTYPETRKIFKPYVINSDTGLIGIPSLIKDENSTSPPIATQPSSLDSTGGIEFTTLLNPNLKPHDFIIMDSKYFRGTYRLVEVNYEGSYEGDEWFCHCKAEVVKDLTWEEATATAESGE